MQLLEEAPGPAGVVPLRPRPHPRDALRRPDRVAPRAAARRGGRGARAHGRPARPSWPTTSSRRRRSAIPRKALEHAAARRPRGAAPRWPTSAPPTSSTRRSCALDLLPEPDEPRRGELLLLRGQAQMQSGGDAARSTLLAAIELARRRGRRRPARPARRSASAASGCRPGSSTTTSSPCSRRRSRGLAPDGSALRARLLVRLAVALYYSDAAQRREDLVQEALGIARALDDPPTLAYVLDQGQIATNGPDTTERGLAWAHELFALADAAGDHGARRSVRARGRSTCCSSSTTSPAPTWRSRRSTASPPTRATRAPAPTSRCTARGGR